MDKKLVELSQFTVELGHDNTLDHNRLISCVTYALLNAECLHREQQTGVICVYLDYTDNNEHMKRYHTYSNHNIKNNFCIHTAYMIDYT